MSDAPHPRSILHVAPRLRVAAGEQLRAVGLAVRREAAAVGALVAAISIMTLIYARRAGGTLSFDGVDDVAGLALTAATVALLAPLAVWKGENRLGSSPIWFLPVGHRRHALVKVGAGWAWLMTAVAAALAWLFLVTVVGGGTFGSGEVVEVLVASDPSRARSIVWITPWWQWAAAFSGATVAYMLASALLLGVRHPWRWLAGLLVAAFVFELASGLRDVSGTALEEGDGPVEQTLEAITYGRYGLDTLLTGGIERLETFGATLPSGERTPAWRHLPDLGSWAVATLLWTGGALAALVAAVSRRREG